MMVVFLRHLMGWRRIAYKIDLCEHEYSNRKIIIPNLEQILIILLVLRAGKNHWKLTKIFLKPHKVIQQDHLILRIEISLFL